MRKNKKIEIGDYIRTKKGDITIVVECLGKDELYKNMDYYETDIFWTNRGIMQWIVYKEDIAESSPNLIEIIKKGDYVNGKRVQYISTTDDFVDVGDTILFERDIKHIVTREQFKEREFIV